jgi:anti-sigma B factor antagonist
MHKRHEHEARAAVRPYEPGDVAGLRVSGALDVAAIPELEQRLDAAIRESDGVFVVEMSEVEFMDSSGLHLLLRARALLAREERHLAVIAPPGPVRRVIDVAGVADLLLPYDDVDDFEHDLVPARE